MSSPCLPEYETVNDLRKSPSHYLILICEGEHGIYVKAFSAGLLMVETVTTAPHVKKSPYKILLNMKEIVSNAALWGGALRL